MVSGTTRTGFEFSAKNNVTDNMEFIDALASLDKGNSLAISDVCRLLMGDDMRQKLYDHVRTSDGRVPLKALESELMDIVEMFNGGKKS